VLPVHVSVLDLHHLASTAAGVERADDPVAHLVARRELRVRTPDLTANDFAAELKRSMINDVLDYVCATADRQAIYYLWRPTLPEPGDDLVLEVAAHGRCERIVTFNVRDFAGSERFGIRAQTPRDFLLFLGAV